MFRPRESLLIALFAFSASWACADTITVNTTTDDNASNNLCSLREAVEYFNHGSPKDGYQGCKAESADSFSIITLPANEKPYLIGAPSGGLGAIYVRAGLTINGEGVSGDKVTTIQVAGPHRAFIINLTPEYQSPCTVSKPCASANSPQLDPASDTGTAGDYLTTVHSPFINGVVRRPAGGYPSGSTYLVRLYDKPKGEERVQVGSVTVDPSSTPGIDAPWQLRVSRSLLEGVHHLVYTVQENNGSTQGTEGPESEVLRVAVYSMPERLAVTLNQLVIKGGGTLCAGANGCANDVDATATAVINDPNGTAYDAYALSFKNLLSNTAGRGGVIYSNEKLLLTNVVVQDGRALSGGALYLADDGGAEISDTDLRANTADDGAALYAEHNGLLLQRSLVRENVVSGAAASAAAVTIADNTVRPGLSQTSLVNTTLSGNNGQALFLGGRDMTVNASTIVLNQAGIYFGAGAAVYNSIVAGNPDRVGTATPSLDCNGPGLGAAVLAYDLVLTTGGCPSAGNQTIANATANSNGALMATLNGGKCNSLYGILCPLADHGGPTPVHMPRVLPGYASIADSPVLNRGSPRVGSSDDDACPSEDQRGKVRIAFACDIGAVELQQMGSGAVAASGGTIVYGQTYTQSLGDDLADEELLPPFDPADPTSPARCPAPDMRVVPPGTVAVSFPPAALADPAKVVPGSYRSDVPGCPWIEKDAGRGRVSFGTDGSYTYRPNMDFHGFDRFEMHVVTTLSNLNALPSDRSRVVSAQVIVEPSGSMVSSKLGGALDGWSLGVLALLGLAWRGRRRA